MNQLLKRKHSLCLDYLFKLYIYNNVTQEG